MTLKEPPTAPIILDEEFSKEFVAYDIEGGIDGMIELFKKRALNDMIIPNDELCVSLIYIKDNAYEFCVGP